MSYIKVEHPLCKTYFPASDDKEEKQKRARNMAAFKDNQAQKKRVESKCIFRSTASFQRGIKKWIALVGQLILAAKTGDFAMSLNND